jgi:hypothetical protein
MAPQGDTFYFVVTVPFVLCKYDPSPLCDKLKPNFIWGAACEMISVPLVLDTIAR